MTVKTGLLCIKCRQVQEWIEENSYRLDDFLARRADLEAEPHWYEYDSELSRLHREFVGHFAHGSRGYLEASSDAGCHLCTLLWHALLRNLTPNGVGYFPSRGEDITIGAALSWYAADKGPIPPLELTVKVANKYASRLWIWKVDPIPGKQSV